MKTLEITGLSNVQPIATGLQHLLADLQVYYTNLRGFHWHIKGREFYQLHEKFEEMYDDVAAKVDEVAERLLMLGETPAHNFSAYLKTASVKETGVVANGDAAVKNILETLKYLIAAERKLVSDAADAGDESTVALIGGYIGEQEKAVWMLTAYLA